MARRVAPRQRLPRPAPWPLAIERTLEQVLDDRYQQLGFVRVPVAQVEPACKEPLRWDIPELLPGTDMFSGYPELRGQTTTVKLLLATPAIYRPLRDAVAALGERPGKSGPKRMDGCVACAFIGFVESNAADVQPWFDSTTPEFWQACGFTFSGPRDHGSNPARPPKTAFEPFRQLSRPNLGTVKRTTGIAEEGLEPPTRGL